MLFLSLESSLSVTLVLNMKERIPLRLEATWYWFCWFTPIT